MSQGQSLGHVRNRDDAPVGYTVFHASELEWQPRRPGDPRLVAERSQALTQSRANLFR